MVPFLEDLLRDVLSQALQILDLQDVIDCAFRAEEQLSEFMGSDLSSIFLVLQSYAIYLIILKFIKKGFDTYVLWNEGDADLDPLIILTGLFKGIIITLSFSTLYDLLINVSEGLIDEILEGITTVDTTRLGAITIIESLLSSGIALCIVGVIFLIMYIVLYIQFIKKGMELLILKAGLPLACVGLMDSDGGVFRPYIKKFFQEVFSVMIQTVMLKFAIALFLGSHYLWGFAALSLALSAPQFLNEFIMSSGGGGFTKVTSAVQVASVAKSFVK